MFLAAEDIVHHLLDYPIGGFSAHQYLLIGLGIAGTMYLACVATGTACYRLAFNRG